MVRFKEQWQRTAFLKVSSTHRETWTRLVGDIWKVPMDGRFSLLFQQGVLTYETFPDSRTEAPHSPKALELIAAQNSTMQKGQSNMSIYDYVNGYAHIYLTNAPKRDVYLGPVFDSTTHDQESTDQNSNHCSSAPWQRIM